MIRYISFIFLLTPLSGLLNVKMIMYCIEFTQPDIHYIIIFYVFHRRKKSNWYQTTRGSVNDERNVIFGWTDLLNDTKPRTQLGFRSYKKAIMFSLGSFNLTTNSNNRNKHNNAKWLFPLCMYGLYQSISIEQWTQWHIIFSYTA